MTINEPTLVLGGTGKTGRRVAARLTALGVPVRIGSRKGEPPFDWEKPATWPAVLAGMRRVYVAYQPDAGFPGADAVVGAFAREAAAAGVERLVLLTGRGEEGALRTEKAAAEAGVPLTVVRAAFFAQNFSEDFFADMVAEGTVVFPAGEVAEPFVDVEDIADVAVAALTDAAHEGRVYELTGPRALTFGEAVAAVAAAAGRDVAYVPVTGAEFGAGMVDRGMPAEAADALGALFAELLDGRNTAVTGGVREALGREPGGFAAYAARAAAEGAWSR